MKVLIVAGFIPPRIGGIERHTHGLASYLSGEPDTQVVVSYSSLKGTLKEKSLYRVIAFP